MKFRNPASRYALVGVFVAKRGGEVRVAVTGAGANGVFRGTDGRGGAEDALLAEVARGHRGSPADGLNSDIHADAEYRAHLIGVMARRARRQPRPSRAGTAHGARIAAASAVGLRSRAAPSGLLRSGRPFSL